MRVLLILMGFLICSCSGSQNYNPVEVGYACEFGGDSARIEMQRFDFNLPNFFLGRECSKYVDYSHDNVGDWLSIAGRLRGGAERGVFAEVFSVGLKLSGGASRMKLENYLPPEEFVAFKWDKSADGEGHRLTSVEWVDRLGARCARFNYFGKNLMHEIRVIEYWCWSGIDGLNVPYSVSVYEVISPGESWKIDLENEILVPLFSSMSFRTLSSEYKNSFYIRRSLLCSRHVKSFEERGVGWLSGKTLEPKWTPVFLKMCGYDYLKS